MKQKTSKLKLAAKAVPIVVQVVRWLLKQRKSSKTKTR